MKKILLSLIAIMIFSTGDSFAQRRSSLRSNARTATCNQRNCKSYYNERGRGSTRGCYNEYRGQGCNNYGYYERGYCGGNSYHYYEGCYNVTPVPPVQHVYHERVVVTPCPVEYSYSYSCPPPPPARTVIVERGPACASVTLGALAGALIGGTIAAVASR